ncbi:MAG TPA: winged helix-turn-helix domain-containing protein [Candidatus Acidoferrales bacterium]|nr:winged helix-turn-helix domain-containing protein [Candidatus Acidoferrales bacterium]
MSGSSQPLSDPGAYRFGPFELDVQSGDLRKYGIRLKLQEKPCQILFSLLERPGEVITREELRARLWGSNTFVEFEHNLDIAVNKLRATLGDTAEAPRYVETIRGTGYRLCATVKVERKQGADAAAAEVEPFPAAPTALPESRTWFSAGARRLLLWATLGACGMGILLAIGWTRLFREPGVPRVLESTQITKEGTATSELLFADGKHLYFLQRGGTGPRLARVPVGGGPAEPLLSIPAGHMVLALHPMRAEVLTTSTTATGSESPLWIYPLQGGSPRRLGELTGHAGAWSPDGKRIVYANGNDLFVADGDGTAARRVLSLPGWALELRWSPKGDVVRFIFGDLRAGTAFLAEARPDGSSFRTLLSANAASDTYLGNWTPDGRYFIYSLARDGRSDVWALPEDARTGSLQTHEPVRLISGPISFSRPVFGGDGKSLYAFGKLPHLEIVQYRAQEGALMPILHGVSADGLAFSRNGTWVAYTVFPERTLWRSRVDGTERLQLTFSPVEALLPQWSPDGQRIVYMARAPRGHWKLRLISIAGGESEQLLPGQEDEGNPSWSPDGSTLVFAGVPWEQFFAPQVSAIYRLDLRTRQVTPLPGSQGLWSPRWSPDGRYIVAETADSLGLRLFDRKAGTWGALAQLTGTLVGYTSWSRDSREVYFNTSATATEEIFYRVPVASRVAERIPVPKGMQQPATLGPWFTVAPNGSLLFLRDASVNEIFSFKVELP